MNTELYNKLINKLEKEMTVAQFKINGNWYLTHIKRLCEEYDFIDINKPIKFDIDGLVRVAEATDLYFNGSCGVVVETGFGNMRYYDCMKPTADELQKFDGHCLIVKDRYNESNS